MVWSLISTTTQIRTPTGYAHLGTHCFQVTPLLDILTDHVAAFRFLNAAGNLPIIAGIAG